jgi:hypothetical protein
MLVYTDTYCIIVAAHQYLFISPTEFARDTDDLVCVNTSKIHPGPRQIKLLVDFDSDLIFYSNGQGRILGQSPAGNSIGLPQHLHSFYSTRLVLLARTAEHLSLMNFKTVAIGEKPATGDRECVRTFLAVISVVVVRIRL